MGKQLVVNQVLEILPAKGIPVAVAAAMHLLGQDPGRRILNGFLVILRKQKLRLHLALSIQDRHPKGLPQLG